VSENKVSKAAEVEITKQLGDDTLVKVAVKDGKAVCPKCGAALPCPTVKDCDGVSVLCAVCGEMLLLSK